MADHIDHVNEAIRATENAEHLLNESERSIIKHLQQAMAAQAQAWATLALGHRVAAASERREDSAESLKAEIESFRRTLEDRPVT